MSDRRERRKRQSSPDHLRRRIAAAVGRAMPAVLLLGLLAVLVPLSASSTTGAIAAVGVAAFVCVLVIFGLERVGTIIVVGAMLFAPIFGDRFAAGALTASDLLAGLGFFLLLPRVLGNNIKLPLLYGCGLVILFGMSVLASAAQDEFLFSALRIARLALALAIIPILFMAWRPSQKLITVMAWAYVIGHTISFAYGFVGPGGRVGSRLIGMSTHPNAFAVCSLFALAMIYYLDSQSTGWRRTAVWGLGAIHLAGLGLSGSRGALLALIGMILVAALLEKSSRLIYTLITSTTVLAVLAPYILVRLDPDSAPNRLLNPSGSASASGSDNYRSDLLSRGWDAFLSNPILGDGYAGVYTFYYHNVYLQILVAAGIFGFIGFLMILWTGVRPLFDAGPTHRLAYGPLGYFAALFFLNTIWDRFAWLPISLVMAAHMLERERAREREAERRPRHSSPYLVPHRPGADRTTPAPDGTPPAATVTKVSEPATGR
ncbi:O-antigen ligase [Nocardioides sp. SYSU D00038]|uniref:O-antigen ligase family protein n=1 Tax=Nocardioides sp. SYSU D00038 TaxID=2812554 RepID=UPI001967663C|nr:O-antigen ligase family protein [Nocardioides sp. SYSU D00038]